MSVRRLSSIRARITMLIVVPLLSLTALWAFVTAVTYGDAAQLLNGKTFQDKSLLPTQKLLNELQKERRLSLERLGASASTDDAPLAAQRRATDLARETVERNAKGGDLRGATVPPVRAKIDALVARLQTLEPARRVVDENSVVAGRTDHRTAQRQRVLTEFSAIIDAGFALYNAPVPADGRIAKDARVLTGLGRAREFLAREDALLSGALATGRLTATERSQFAQLVGAQRTLYADTVPNLPPAEADRYQSVVASPQFEQLRRLEEQVMRDSGRETKTTTARTGQTAQTGVPQTGARTTVARPSPPVEARAWRGALDHANERLYGFENEVLKGVTARATDIGMGTFLRLLVAGGLGLVAVVASALIAVRISRRLLRECRELASRVTDFARERLPVLADRVRSGQPLDPADEPAEFDYRINEIGEIAESFAATRDAVLVAGAREVAARRGLSEVFVNLARRNQALLHRQLSLLDTMERRVEDPSELADLFRLDHLSTRMRRHAEGLVILAGKHAGRGWRKPVPLVDVVRGAVAEVEDYPRVRVQPMPRIALLGSAVADVIHLLAELVENATSFSPPQSPVLVSGHAVGSGFVIEIEDHGLGMTPEAMNTANERLAEPPEFDPSDSARLGLFVVARLAKRHDIRVTLRQSAYGGTTAIALIPANLIVDSPEPEAIARRTTGPMELPSGGEQQAPVRLVAQPVGSAASNGSASSSATSGDTVNGTIIGGPEPSPPAPERTVDGLPKRRRQQHMAPQLREQTQERRMAAFEGPPAPPIPDPQRAPEPQPEPLAAPVPEPDAEAMKSKLSSMQRGWQRGRDEAQQSAENQTTTHQQATPQAHEEDDTR